MEKRRKIALPEGYEYDRWFIRQSTSALVRYDAEYKMKQSTNAQMSYLRIGWLSAHLPYGELKNLKSVDVGSGNGVFTQSCRDIGIDMCEYDLSGDSISREELYGTTWGLVVMSDVLEHFDRIDDLFVMRWKYCFLSFPETPDVSDFDELTRWRHFKPGEHIYHLYRDGVESWVNSMDGSSEIISHSNSEDFIRKRWDDDLPNITTMLIRRKSCW